jgi:cytochrome P450
MTALRRQDQAERPAEERRREGLASATLPEALAVVATGVVPALVRGLFSPRRSAMKLLTSLDADGRAAGVLTKLRRKHDGQGIKLLGGRLVVVWGESAIKEVLDRSADAYAGDAGAKAKGMCHFQPDALTLSHGDDWRDRRAFNEAVLASSERRHPFAGRFLSVVSGEVERLGIRDTLVWTDWERLFDRVTLRVIFGDEAREDQALTARLEKLMGEANRLVGLRRSDDYFELYGQLERYLVDPGAESLVAQIAAAPQTDRTRIVHQIPHWIFAMRDTLAANAYRALAAIVADPGVHERVLVELEGVDLGDPVAVDGLRYLEGCLQEAMRLWPTTPLLARETTREVTLAGEPLDPGTQVMLLNAFNHRDPDHVEEADRLQPERWNAGERDYRFNHLSNGAQDCPGGPLVLLLGKAAIARILERHSLVLEQPRLAPGATLPHMLDFFETRFSAQTRAPA